MKLQGSSFAIFGATSAIASATALLLAREGARLFLIGRDEFRTKAIADDIHTRTGTQAEYATADLNRTQDHEQLISWAVQKLGRLDGVVVAHGILGDQQRSSTNFADAELVLNTNFLSPVSILTHVARQFELQGSGQIVVIGSVAGDRGRQSNYVYGASKGGLEIFVQGLRNRLAKSSVGVLLVKPGFVDTPMTRHLAKNALFTQPETIARGIVAGIRNGSDSLYLPFYWRYIMALIRAIPERVFKKMKL